MCRVLFFFFNDTATTEIYTLSLHDALPISAGRNVVASRTATATTNSPPTPTERVSESGVATRAANPTTTVSPDVITAEPAVSTVRMAAAAGDGPRVDSSRDRATMRSDE